MRDCFRSLLEDLRTDPGMLMNRFFDLHHHHPESKSGVDLEFVAQLVLTFILVKTINAVIANNIFQKTSKNDSGNCYLDPPPSHHVTHIYFVILNIFA